MGGPPATLPSLSATQPDPTYLPPAPPAPRSPPRAPRYTSDWALDVMGSSFLAACRLVRSYYASYYNDGLRWG